MALQALPAEGGGKRPVLIGTWAAGNWAIEFYRRNGFELVPDSSEPDGACRWTKDVLLRTYWFAEGLGALNSPADPHRIQQMDASVVLADQAWFEYTSSEQDSGTTLQELKSQKDGTKTGESTA